MAKRHQPLVCQHLENLGVDALERYAQEIRQIAHRRHGVYALYRKGKLYYVGLASNLRSRLGHHLKDQHRERWDRFSVYLTIDSRQMKELESLVLRIAQPIGNKNKGRFAKSDDLRRQLERSAKDRFKDELAHLTGRAAKPKAAPVTREKRGELANLTTKAMWLKVRFKGKLFWARTRRDGQIRFDGRLFKSPSAAAVALRQKPTNGWDFWQYERAPGDWVPLAKLR